MTGRDDSGDSQAGTSGAKKRRAGKQRRTGNHIQIQLIGDSLLGSAGATGISGLQDAMVLPIDRT